MIYITNTHIYIYLYLYIIIEAILRNVKKKLYTIYNIFEMNNE